MPALRTQRATSRAPSIASTPVSAAQPEDYSTFFGTLGLPNLKI